MKIFSVSQELSKELNNFHRNVEMVIKLHHLQLQATM